MPRAPGPAGQDVSAGGLFLSTGPAGAQTQCAVNSNSPSVNGPNVEPCRVAAEVNRQH